MAYSVPAITAAPALNAALAPRQDDGLSSLISNGIILGNSILSQLQATTTTPSTLSTSTTPTTSSTSSTSSSSTSSLQSQPSSTSTPTTTSSPVAAVTSSSHSNTLAIGLGVALGVLALLLLLGLLWFCLRRRRKAKKTVVDNKSESEDSWSASHRSQLIAPNGGYDFDRHGPYSGINAPAPVMTERSHPYADRHEYEPMSPSSTHSLAAVHSNPFTAAHERPGAVFAPGVGEPSSWDSSEPHKPVLRPAAPAEMEGSSTTLLPHSGQHHLDHNHGKGRAEDMSGAEPNSIWPSQKEANKFDFGISERESAELAESDELLDDRRTAGDEFVVPRRPVSGQPTAL